MLSTIYNSTNLPSTGLTKYTVRGNTGLRSTAKIFNFPYYAKK